MMTPTMTTAKSKVIFDEPGRAADPVLLSYFAPSYVMYEYKFCILSLEHKTLLVLSPIRDPAFMRQNDGKSTCHTQGGPAMAIHAVTRSLHPTISALIFAPFFHALSYQCGFGPARV